MGRAKHTEKPQMKRGTTRQGQLGGIGAAQEELEELGTPAPTQRQAEEAEKPVRYAGKKLKRPREDTERA